jgi:PucR-like helix-turn-helix protein/diguanylate cyclase with GGDEF domain/purine catabolism regulatory family protein
MATPRSVTVRQLLGTPAFADVHLVGGEAGLDRSVCDVVVRQRLSLSADLERDVLVVIDGANAERHSYLVDQAIRCIDERSASGVVIASGPQRLGETARRMADRFQVPLLTTTSVDLLEFAHRIRGVLRAPDVERADGVLELIGHLERRPAANTDDVLAAIRTATGARCALVSADSTVVTGDSIELGGRPLPAEPRVHVDRSVEHSVIAVPVVLDRGDRPSFWLVAALLAPESAEGTARALLQIGAMAITSQLAAERLRRERDARYRLGLLNELLGGGELPEASLVAQMETLGWNAVGWCSAIHIQLSGDVDPSWVLARSAELNRLLEQAGVVGPLIERSDGWTAWTLSAREPSPDYYGSVTASLRTALAEFVRRYGRIGAHGGVGRPYEGLAGLRRSLGEAREAAIISQAAGDASGADHVDQLGVQRILMGWYASDDFAGFAETLLRPLTAADHHGELARTLETYLDERSSATATATSLGLHRNTVMNRIERVTQLLGIEFDRPEQRLAVQLALRVRRLRTT